MKNMSRLVIFLLRFLANHCVFPSIRMALFRASGIMIGKDTFINMSIFFIDNYRGKGSIIFGNRVSVASNVMFIADADPNNSILQNVPRFCISGTIIIKDDAWIGAGVIILPNITVGKAAVVGAGSIVTKDVPNYCIVAGNPAKKIGEINVDEINAQ